MEGRAQLSRPQLPRALGFRALGLQGCRVKGFRVSGLGHRVQVVGQGSASKRKRAFGSDRADDVVHLLPTANVSRHHGT